MRRAVVIQHVGFEDLGTLEPVLRHSGFSIEYLQAGVSDLSAVQRRSPDLLIVLGGPIGAYQAAEFPFLNEEHTIICERLHKDQAVLGICLGAQLLAAAMGARVFPGTQGKEIGWSPIQAGQDEIGDHPIRFLHNPNVSMLHWHGDTFDLPSQVKHLASTAQYPHQAFCAGRKTLGLQFHPEVTVTGLERWYIGHSAELAQAGIKIERLREDSRRFGPALEAAAPRFWREWVQKAFLPQPTAAQELKRV